MNKSHWPVNTKEIVSGGLLVGKLWKGTVKRKMDQLIGKKLDGRYVLLEQIGNGGMAQVYRAQDLANGKIVAVKVLKEQFMDNDEIVQRFKNESRAISMLDHPNIVRVYDVSVWDKTQFIVMELIEGVDLKQFMTENGGRLTWKETVKFAEETLQALQHAHEHGIVHRDIKPQNIMLLKDGSIKVMDFGIARFSRSGVHTATDKAMGSVHYISPEQARGDVTDAKSDLYSVGIMMYEMLTGQLPFDGDSNVAVAIKQISEEARPLKELNPEAPEGLVEIIHKAMEKQPSKRYESAQAMLEDIARFKENPSIQFAYQYINNTPTRYMDAVKETRNKKTAGASEQTASKKKKKKKGLSHYVLPVLAGMAVAFLLGSAILVYMIFHFSGNTLFETREDVELPNFVGMTADEILNNRNYTSQFVFTVKESYRTDYEAGDIYDQNPKGGKIVKEGHEVILRVSKGVQIVEIPNVVSYTKEEAVETLTALDLSVMVSYETGSDVPIGQVIRTDPEAGTQLSTGQQVKVFVSAEKVDNMRTVPNLVGLANADEAKKLLNQYTLTLGTVTEVESEHPAGTVLEQSVAPDTKVYTGSSIGISTSLGYVTKTWKVKVTLEADSGKEILNGQKIKYGEKTYETKDGGKKQSFTFEVSTIEASVTVKIMDKEYKITADTEITLTVKAANRPDDCTCAKGENHKKDNAKCKHNIEASKPDSSSKPESTTPPVSSSAPESVTPPESNTTPESSSTPESVTPPDSSSEPESVTPPASSSEPESSSAAEPEIPTESNSAETGASDAQTASDEG